MTTPNEELQARLLAAADEAMDCGLETDDSSLLREAAAALARQEEGREAVYQHEVRAGEWRDIGLDEYQSIGEAYRRILYTHPAPPIAGEGDAEPMRSCHEYNPPRAICVECMAGSPERCVWIAEARKHGRPIAGRYATSAPATPQAAGDRPWPKFVRDEILEILRNVDTQFRATGQPSARIERAINMLAGMPLTTAGQQAAGVSDAYRELMEVRAGLCTLGVMGPGETAAEALQRYVTRCTAAGAAPEGDKVLIGWVRPQMLIPRHSIINRTTWNLGVKDERTEEYSVPVYAHNATPNPGAQHGQEGRE